MISGPFTSMAVGLMLAGLLFSGGTLWAFPPANPRFLEPLKEEVIAQGLFYSRYARSRIIAHVLRMDLKSRDLRVRSIKAHGTETIRQIVERVGEETTVLGAINGDFFRQGSSAGLPYGVHISDGQLICCPTQRSMIGFGPLNEPCIDVAKLDARITFAPPEQRGPPALWAQVNQINPMDKDTQREDSIHLYTPAFLGRKLPRPSGHIAVVEAVQPGLRVGEVCEGKVARIETGERPSKVPELGCLIYLSGEEAPEVLERVKPGQQVAIKVELPPIAGGVSQAIGGGPRLLRDGKRSVELSKEGFDSFQGFEIQKRHPRSAVGYDEKKNTLFLVMVEGRHAGSQGMTFGELADFMKEVGCWQAMGFDGGGSAGLYVAGKGFVSHSRGGFGQEDREVANGLFITRERSSPVPPIPGGGG